MYDFTKKKFLALSSHRQHKKCAELLCFVYNKLMNQEEWEAEWQLYQQLLEWMNEPMIQSPSIQKIADRYHAHLQQAALSKREHHLLPQIRKGDRIQGEAAWPIAIYLDHIRSAHNVGSMIRTVEALALGSLYFSPQTPFITHKQVQDTAMGAIQWVNCYQGIELASLPHPMIVLETSQEAISLYEMIFPSSFTLVVGNEEYGCSDETLKRADYLVEIPLRGHKNSLNVANAFAMAAGEISRQLHINKITESQLKDDYGQEK
jgi:tRNA G18 (ribose-2'-O)-methylase SpoU